MTEQDVADLKTAIDLARRPGACAYEEGGAPCCVIGQFLSIRGLSLADLKALDRGPSDGSIAVGEWGHRGAEVEAEKAIAGVRIELLQLLQNRWDGGEPGQEERLRAEMREILHRVPR